MAYLILLALNSLDFLTGLVASKLERKKITSRKAKDGVLRKCAEWLAVAVALCATYITDYFNVSFPAAPVVVCWLSICEIISILENLGRAGLKVPAKILNQLKNVLEVNDNEKNNKTDSRQ